MSVDLLSTFLPAAESVPSRPLTLEIGTTFGPFTINLYSSRATLVGRYTVVPSTDVFTIAAHGLSNGNMVQVQALSSSVVLTDGLDTGELYFIKNATTDTFQLSVTPGGSAVDVKSSDSGYLYRNGTPFNLTNCKVWAWVKAFASDPDNDLVLDLQPTITGAVKGTGYDWQVTFMKTKEQTFNLTPSTNVWDLIIQFADGTRAILIEDTFTIAQPATHPNLAAS